MDAQDNIAFDDAASRRHGKQFAEVDDRLILKRLTPRPEGGGVLLVRLRQIMVPGRQLLLGSIITSL